MTIWYSAVVLFSITAFGSYSYFWVSNKLYSNLDTSLEQIASTLNHIIRESGQSGYTDFSEQKLADRLFESADKFAVFRGEEKSRFIGPLHPDRSIEKKDENRDVVWSAIFKHILLNPDYYYIQIADTTKQIIWRSRNLIPYSLPVDSSYITLNLTPQGLSRINQNNTIFDDVIIDEQKLRLLVKQTNNAIISIAYTVKDVETTLNDLFLALMLALPLIIFASILGGIFLSKLSLKTVDDITRKANEISAKNLSFRLEELPTNDEISRLTITLNKMMSRLEASFEQVRQFTSDASHELRTPLTILRGEMEIALQRERTQEEYMIVINSSLEEVIRLSKAVDELLELSRADAGQIKLNFKKNDLSSMIAEIFEDMEIIAAQKDITLTNDIDKKVFMDFDALRLYQAVLNVLDNAVKYTRNGGTVKVILKNRVEFVEIRIIDTGIGISDNELKHIFDRFYRVDKARAADTKGTGLGLSIVKWIIESHNGKIFIESTEGKGTNFIIMLPVKQVD